MSRRRFLIGTASVLGGTALARAALSAIRTRTSNSGINVGTGPSVDSFAQLLQPIGASGTYLRSTGSAPAWSTILLADISHRHFLDRSFLSNELLNWTTGSLSFTDPDEGVKSITLPGQSNTLHFIFFYGHLATPPALAGFDLELFDVTGGSQIPGGQMGDAGNREIEVAFMGDNLVSASRVYKIRGRVRNAADILSFDFVNLFGFSSRTGVPQ